MRISIGLLAFTITITIVKHYSQLKIVKERIQNRDIYVFMTFIRIDRFTVARKSWVCTMSDRIVSTDIN